VKGSTRLGFGIASLFAGGVIAFSLFSDKHESWFVRAAQDGAIRCLTGTACTQMDAAGAVTAKAKPPLGTDSVCAERKGWKELQGVSNGQTSIVVTCTEGRTFLYHFGALKNRKDAGPEQWMACAEASCRDEAKLFAN
jgi:hypothetical protein